MISNFRLKLEMQAMSCGIWAKTQDLKLEMQDLELETRDLKLDGLRLKCAP